MESAVSFVGEKLLPLFLKLVNAIHEVPKNVEDIKKQLENIQDIVNDEERRAGTEEGKERNINKDKVKQLMKQTICIEDVTEDYMINEEQRSHDPGCASLPCETLESMKAMIRRLQISYEIQGIKLRVHAIDRPLQRPSFDEGLHNLRMNALHIKEDDVVGFEAPRDELIGWLEETRKETTMIYVVGMGGQGKTTLAKMVFDKMCCMEKFDCYARITVSQICDAEVLLKEVLNKLGGGIQEAPTDISINLLIEQVSNYLQQKRYIILFDDVWDRNILNNIKFAFPKNEKRSRILITTRNNEVAQSCRDSFITHIQNLQPLPPNESWDLFCKNAFLNEPGRLCPERLKNISSKIVEKCNGLPLAIIAAGSLLARRGTNLSEWQNLHTTLISELERNPNLTGITDIILGLSYDDCPYYLKPCFLYFGIYPENYEFESATLIKQWVAEGFVRFEEETTLEGVAEKYLRELVHRNLVQVSSFSIDGKVKRCRVHSLLHKLILRKIKDLCFCDSNKDRQPMFSGVIRRLKIETNSENFMVNTKDSCIRSLYIFGGVELPNNFVPIIPIQYKLLKVLEFVHSPLTHPPENLGNLIRLRYLSFRKTNVASLPNSIGNLQFLETLDLRQTLVRQMPKEINKLTKLRHLLANHTIWGFGNGIQMMEGFGALVKLQTLRQVETDYRGEELVKELEKLTELRLLGLINVKQEYGNSLCSSVNKMEHLEKLFIDASPFGGVIDLHSISPLLPLQKLRLRGKLETMPNWISGLENLVRLSLISSQLIKDPLKSLAQMPSLLYLSLGSAYEGESLVFPDGGFKALMKLSFRHMYSLNSIKVGKGALPSLEELVLEFIPQLNNVPFGIDNLSMLGIFHIINMPEEFRESIREDQWIKDHVRQVYIIDKVVGMNKETCLRDEWKW